jgi:hypothetical protein
MVEEQSKVKQYPETGMYNWVKGLFHRFFEFFCSNVNTSVISAVD